MYLKDVFSFFQIQSFLIDLMVKVSLGSDLVDKTLHSQGWLQEASRSKKRGAG